MTPEEFAAKMLEASKITYSHWGKEYADIEDSHAAMDDLMCNLLRSLGYGDGIDIFEKAEKWYA